MGPPEEEEEGLEEEGGAEGLGHEACRRRQAIVGEVEPRREEVEEGDNDHPGGREEHEGSVLLPLPVECHHLPPPPPVVGPPKPDEPDGGGRSKTDEVDEVEDVVEHRLFIDPDDKNRRRSGGVSGSTGRTPGWFSTARRRSRPSAPCGRGRGPERPEPPAARPT